MHEKVPEKKETSNIRSLRKATKQSFELNIIGMRYEEAMIAVDNLLIMRLFLIILWCVLFMVWERVF